MSEQAVAIETTEDKRVPKAVVPAAQRKRSIAIGISLVLLVVLFFAATLVRLGGNVAERMRQEGKPMAPTIVIPDGDAVSVEQARDKNEQ
ncbi:MAG: hypothetical protein AAFQ35_00895 [Pseudomonadota bacterium]